MFRGGWRATQGGGGGTSTLGWASISSSNNPYTFSTTSGTNAVAVTMTTGDLDIMLPSAAAGVGLVYTIRHVAGSLTASLLKIKSNGGDVEGSPAGVGVIITSNQSTTRVSSNGTEWLII